MIRFASAGPRRCANPWRRTVATLAFMGMIRRHWLTFMGLVVAVIGGLVLAWARTDQFGWTSYAPLHTVSVTASSVWIFDRRQALVGLLMLLAGVGITGAGIGLAVGRQRGSSIPPNNGS